MDVYGLTGGIGSGKSAVADLLESYGIPVVSADELSRIVVSHGSEGLRDVVRSFGPEILDESGELDRRKLASIVFENPARRKELESILHPRIRERFEQVLDALEKADHEVAVYEVPLLFEKNLQTEMKAVILVTADEDVRIRRVQLRDDVTEAEVRARMAAQMDEDSKRRRADYVIENDGTEDDLRREVEFMLERFMRIGGQRAKTVPRHAAQTILTAPRRNAVTSIYAPLPPRGTISEVEEDASPSLGVRLDTPVAPPRPSREGATTSGRAVMPTVDRETEDELEAPAYDAAVPVAVEEDPSRPWAPAERSPEAASAVAGAPAPSAPRPGRSKAAPERRSRMQAAKTAPHRSAELPASGPGANEEPRGHGTHASGMPAGASASAATVVTSPRPSAAGSSASPSTSASAVGSSAVTSLLSNAPLGAVPASGNAEVPSSAGTAGVPLAARASSGALSSIPGNPGAPSSASGHTTTVSSLSVPPTAPPLVPPPPLRPPASPAARKEPEDARSVSRNEPPPPPALPRRSLSPVRRGEPDDDSSSET